MRAMSTPVLAGYTPLRQKNTSHRHEGGHDMHVSICIKGHLNPSWQQGLEGLQIVHEENGTSRLVGVLKDQAALFGVLKRIDHLSLTLLSLERTEQDGRTGGDTSL
jgi:hypothetical protein